MFYLFLKGHDAFDAAFSYLHLDYDLKVEVHFHFQPKVTNTSHAWSSIHAPFPVSYYNLAKVHVNSNFLHLPQSLHQSTKFNCSHHFQHLYFSYNNYQDQSPQNEQHHTPVVYSNPQNWNSYTIISSRDCFPEMWSLLTSCYDCCTGRQLDCKHHRRPSQVSPSAAFRQQPLVDGLLLCFDR